MAPILAGVLSTIAIASFTGVFLFRRHRTQKAKAAYHAVIEPYTTQSFKVGGGQDGQPSDPTSNPSRTKGIDGQRMAPSYFIAKPEGALVTSEAREETLAAMRHVAEIREETARLRQVLIHSQQLDPTSSSDHFPDQAAQLSEMRGEMQRLRHLDSLQPTYRQNILAGVSRTTSPPVYEE